MRKHLKFGLNRWASFSRRVALYHKRALREAVYFWNTRYVTLVFQHWKLHVKEVVSTRLRLLLQMKNKDIFVAFKAWFEFYTNVKNKKNRLRHLIQVAVSRWKKKTLAIGFYQWQKLWLTPKELPPVELPKDLERLFASAKEDVITYQKKTMKLTDDYYKRFTTQNDLNYSMNSNTPSKENVDIPIYDSNLDDVAFLKLLNKIADDEDRGEDELLNSSLNNNEDEDDDDDYLFELFTKTKKKKMKKRMNNNFKFRYSGVGNTSSIDIESL